jgi:nitrate/nitrite transporter NarK
VLVSPWFQGEEFSRLLGRSQVYVLSILYDVNFGGAIQVGIQLTLTRR